MYVNLVTHLCVAFHSLFWMYKSMAVSPGTEETVAGRGSLGHACFSKIAGHSGQSALTFQPNCIVDVLLLPTASCLSKDISCLILHVVQIWEETNGFSKWVCIFLLSSEEL